MSSPEEIQAIQTAYRRQIVETWPIGSGARVLEIGCGQGDMTAVLADVVGPDGHVTAIDYAGRDYGAPLTLGQATDRIKASPLGSRIDFKFNTNVFELELPKDHFDAVVFAHSLWYLPSHEHLYRMLERVRDFSAVLCLAEWSLEPRTLEQVPHLLAALLQGQIETLTKQGLWNIRTPFDQFHVYLYLIKTRWQKVVDVPLDTRSLQDADWEITAAIGDSLGGDLPASLPEAFTSMVSTQRHVLADLSQMGGNAPLPAYSIVAHRTDEDLLGQLLG